MLQVLVDVGFVELDVFAAEGCTLLEFVGVSVGILVGFLAGSFERSFFGGLVGGLEGSLVGVFGFGFSGTLFPSHEIVGMLSED